MNIGDDDGNTSASTGRDRGKRCWGRRTRAPKTVLPPRRPLTYSTFGTVRRSVEICGADMRMAFFDVCVGKYGMSLGWKPVCFVGCVTRDEPVGRDGEDTGRDDEVCRCWKTRNGS